MFMLSGRPLYAVGFAVAVAALVWIPPALAEPAPPYEVLIDQLDQIPLAIEAEALHSAATARIRQARALPNPEIALEAENVYGRSPFAGYGSAETTLSINQPLELWGQRGARVNAAQAQADAVGLRREQVRWTTAGVLAQAYAEAEAASLRYDLAVEALSLTQADAAAVMALVEEGRESTLRGVQAESEVEAARAMVDEARANRDAAFAYLTALAMRAEPITSIGTSLLDRAPKPATPAARDFLAVQVAEAELDAADRLVTVERLRARPDVTASLGVRRFEEYDVEALTFGVSVSLPLFDRNTGAISAARAERRAAEARLDSQKWEAQAAYRAAQAGLDASISRTRAADGSVAAAEEAYRLARVGFDAGRISQLELRSSRAALISSRNATVNARLARVRAEIDLARLEGRAPFGEAP